MSAQMKQKKIEELSIITNVFGETTEMTHSRPDSPEKSDHVVKPYHNPYMSSEYENLSKMLNTRRQYEPPLTQNSNSRDSNFDRIQQSQKYDQFNRAYQSEKYSNIDHISTLSQLLQRGQQSQQKIEHLTRPITTKVNLINSKNVDELREIMRNFNRQICASLENTEIINIDDITEDFNMVSDKISKYNESISKWYDNKYYSDKEKLYESIEDEVKKFYSFENNDFISF